MKPPGTLFCSISFGSCRSSTRPQPKIRVISLRFGLVKCALAWLLLKSSSKGWAAIYRFQKHLLYSIHSFSHGGRFSKQNRLVVVCTASPVHCFSSYQLASSPPRQCTASPHITLPRHPHASNFRSLLYLFTHSRNS